jgi:hypothetical protein
LLVVAGQRIRASAQQTAAPAICRADGLRDVDAKMNSDRLDTRYICGPRASLETEYGFRSPLERRYEPRRAQREAANKVKFELFTLTMSAHALTGLGRGASNSHIGYSYSGVSGCRSLEEAEVAVVADTNRQPRVRSAVLLALGMIAAAGVAAALVLWAHFGTAVFFDMVAAGIAYCF